MDNSNAKASNVDNEQGQLSRRVIVPMSEEMIAEISDYRFGERRDSQADAVRELVKIGLEAWRKGQKGGTK